MILRLEAVGVSPEMVDALRKEYDRETALILVAMYDDRHEYLD